MKKFAIVKFIGNEKEYLTGANCNEYDYCKQCPQNDICTKERSFLFVLNKEYKAYFLDYCQGVRDVLEIESEKGIQNFVPINDFIIVDNSDNALNNYYAIVKCADSNGIKELVVGREYQALKISEDKRFYYVLDELKDCYYYPKYWFEIVEDDQNILQ